MAVQGDLNEQNAHPRDAHVQFEAATHTYTIHGSAKDVTSVTGLLDGYIGKFDPDAVLDKYYTRWQQNILKKPDYHGKSREEIKKLWKEKAEKAATEGTKLHKAIEEYYKDDYVDLEYTKERKEWKHFIAFQGKHKLKAFRTEMVLWSDDHLLGGSIDMVVKNDDGTFSIFDWKRTKDAVRKDEHHWGRYGDGPLSSLPDTKYYKYSMQLNLYRELLQRYYGYTVKSMHIVRLHPDAASFELTDIDRMESETNALLECRCSAICNAGPKDLENQLRDLAIKE